MSNMEHYRYLLPEWTVSTKRFEVSEFAGYLDGKISMNIPAINERFIILSIKLTISSNLLSHRFKK